jgi:phosphorylcholine metabolism protein LicD
MGLKQQATENLKDVKRVLDSLGITFWLDGGTLLGAYRDKDFCVGDEDDIDLCTWDNYLPLRGELINRLEELGFELLHEWELEICVDRGGSRVDLFYNKRNSKEAYTHIYAGEQIHRYVVIPIRFYERLEKLRFKGEVFYAPGPIEEFLTLKYGDWKTPIHRSKYRCDNAQQNKLIRKSYG